VTILQQLGEVNTNIETRQRAREFVAMARFLMAARGNRTEAHQLAVAGRAPDRVKAAVAAQSISGSGAPLAEYQQLSTGFLESLRSAGAFDAMLTSMVPVPLRTRVVVVTTSATGSVVAEGAAKSISSMALANAELEQQKAAALVAITTEMAQLGGAATLNLLRLELSGAVRLATDVEFLSILLAGVTPITATTNFLSDLSSALAAMGLSAQSKIFLIARAQTARILALKPNTAGGGQAYPGLGLNGGEFGGMTMVVSDAAAAGQVVVADASQIAAASDIISLDASTQATVQLNTAPVGDATAVATSLWQHNMTALRAERWFGAEKLRTTAVSAITGVTA